MRTPVEVVDAWNAAYDARDAEALVALAHEDVELVTPGRGTQRGHEAIRESVRRQTYGVGMHVGTHRRLHRDEPVVTAGTIELRFVDSGELAERFPVSRPAISRHLRVLREAGLVRSRVEGRRRLYSLDPRPLRELDDWLEPYRDLWAQRLDALDTEMARGRRARGSGGAT